MVTRGWFERLWFGAQVGHSSESLRASSLEDVESMFLARQSQMGAPRIQSSVGDGYPDAVRRLPPGPNGEAGSSLASSG
jgi:hypothetical protein